MSDTAKSSSIEQMQAEDIIFALTENILGAKLENIFSQTFIRRKG